MVVSNRARALRKEHPAVLARGVRFGSVCSGGRVLGTARTIDRPQAGAGVACRRATHFFARNALRVMSRWRSMIASGPIGSESGGAFGIGLAIGKVVARRK